MMQEHKPSKKPLLYYAMVATIIILLLNALVFPLFMGNQVIEVGYSDFLAMVDAGSVTQVARDEQEGTLTFLAKDEKGRERIYQTGIWPDDDLTDRLTDKGVVFAQSIPTQASPLMTLLFSWVLPVLFFVLLGQLLSKKLMGGMGAGNGHELWQGQCQGIYRVPNRKDLRGRGRPGRGQGCVDGSGGFPPPSG